MKSIYNIRQILSLSFFAVLLMTAASSCNTSGCTDNRSSVPIAGFYSMATELPITLDSISIFGVGSPGDSLLVAAGQKVKQVYLPLRSDRESVTFQIDYEYRHLLGLSDIITIYYESFPYFASEECGAMYRYKIRDIQHSDLLLDSISLIAPDSIITNAERETIQLFFITE